MATRAQDARADVGVDVAVRNLTTISARLLGVSKLLALNRQPDWAISRGVVPVLEVSSFALADGIRSQAIAGTFNAPRQQNGIATVPATEEWRISFLTWSITNVGVAEQADLYLGHWPGFGAPSPLPATPLVSFAGPGPTILERGTQPWSVIMADPDWWYPPGSQFSLQSGDSSSGAWDAVVTLHLHRRLIG